MQGWFRSHRGLSFSTLGSVWFSKCRYQQRVVKLAHADVSFVRLSVKDRLLLDRIFFILLIDFLRITFLKHLVLSAMINSCKKLTAQITAQQNGC